MCVVHTSKEKGQLTMNTSHWSTGPQPGIPEPIVYTLCSCGERVRTMIELINVRTLCPKCIARSFKSFLTDAECDRCGAPAVTVEVVERPSHYEMVNVCADCIGEEQ